ncbi:MAG: CRISPR-associated endonuclease Cas2 [Leptospiraceae bacterium]|nr:CRISPR-associated endonuclease Cas2 [Leptospiraceae bacterium]
MNKLYVICYDFPSDKAGDKRRNKVIKILGGHGERVQYSVFEVRFKKPEELEILVKRVKIQMDEKEDSLRIYPISGAAEKDTIILGKGELFHREEDYFF